MAVTDTYIYEWKTSKGWTGCRRLIVSFADAAGTADFQLNEVLQVGHRRSGLGVAPGARSGRPAEVGKHQDAERPARRPRREEAYESASTGMGQARRQTEEHVLEKAELEHDVIDGSFSGNASARFREAQTRSHGADSGRASSRIPPHQSDRARISSMRSTSGVTNRVTHDGSAL
jgi:hypothetical protein